MSTVTIRRISSDTVVCRNEDGGRGI
jgi:hypothetical protein